MRLFSLALMVGLLGAGHPIARAQERLHSTDSLGPVAEEVVFSIGDRFVTRSDLEIEARVVLVLGGGVAGASSRIPVETVVSVMDYVINQLLILQEVERLQVFEVSPEEVAQEYSRLLAAFPNTDEFEAFRAHLAVGPERLSAILHRNLRVQRYLESRVRLTVRVAEDEVVAFFVEDAESFGDRSLEEVREAIRGHLFRQRFEASVRTLVAELRRRADLRILAEPVAFPAISYAGGILSPSMYEEEEP